MAIPGMAPVVAELARSLAAAVELALPAWPVRAELDAATKAAQAPGVAV
jgi:hypothetical protein